MVEKPVVPVDKLQKVVLYRREVNGKWEWYKHGNDEKDGKYVGEFKNGNRNGQGTMFYPGLLDTKIKYVGEWRRDIRWDTILSDDDGNYLGRWVKGKEVREKKPIAVVKKKKGKVLFHLFMNGKLGWYKKNDTTINFGTYVGEIKNGKPNGIGTNTYQYDLGKYEGEWKDGEMHGQGTHYKFGRVSKGEFRKNNPWNTTISNNKGEIIGKYVSGKYIGE